MALPFLALLALAAAWSGAWFHLAGRAEAALERRLAAEAAAGRRLDCRERTVSGFPFRFEVICDRPVLTLAAPALTLSAERLHTAMQVYDPSLVIAEIAGPATIRPAGGSAYSAAFRLAQASYRGTPDRLTRAALVLDDVSLREIPDGKTAGLAPAGTASAASAAGTASTASAAGTTNAAGAPDGAAGAPLLSAKRLEFHLRPTPDAPPGMRDLDFTADATGLAVPDLPPARLDLRATAFALPDRLARNAPEALRSWQANGGRLGISLLRLESERFLARAAGSLGLDAAGRPEGRITADVAGLDRLASGSRGAWSSLVPALRFAGKPTKVEDRSGVALEFNAEHGVVRLGPVRLLTLPAVY